MPHTQHAGPDLLVVDLLRLANSLDDTGSRDWVERIGHAITQANDSLQELNQRRVTLTVSAADAVIIDRLLDVIRARLTFLEALHRGTLPYSPVRR
ncbi:MAG TPA: hypothetical protein VJU82_01770 [Acidobacteriaceae bacterium]|nr:hypothetical protein [Acidobacteriaceae bacterium]